MARKKDPHSYVTRKEAERAIYIDFEGFEEKSPTLIGILVEDEFEQVVLDPQLQEAAIAKGMRQASLKEEIARLVERGKREDRFFAAYSRHELNVVQEFAGVDLSDTFRDARKIAKKWKNKFHKEAAAGCRSLKDYLAFIGYERGAHLGERKSTSRIKTVKEMLEKRVEFKKLTPTAKAKWTKLLDHNEIDCRGMKALVLRAAMEWEKSLDGRKNKTNQ